jgi:sulfoxide reductase catalytic subunit YedY
MLHISERKNTRRLRICTRLEAIRVHPRPPITHEAHAASYNNFYEFSVFKGAVYKKAARLRTSPWRVEVGGLVEKRRIFDIDELLRALPLEERRYRFRCVEAWVMAVPWPGFPCALC